jgi:peptidoglycan/xylan/chitin deacetylase (PgdA/CDA1 family)
MSPQPPRRVPTEEEIRRRRVIAFSALGTAFVLLLLAVVLAVAGSGGDGGGGQAAVPDQQSTTPKPAKRPKPKPAAPGFTPVPASAPGAHKAPKETVPILVYNVIKEPQPDTANPEDWVPPDEFAAEMDYLAKQGFHGVTLRQVRATWKEGGLLPSKPVVISFDIGYHSVLANALPVLRGHEWTGTLFLQASQTEADFPADEVKALVQAGWELDSHGQTGADLTPLTDEELDAEVVGARRALQRDFTAKVEFFSYPQGSFDDRVKQAVQAAGFLGAATLDEGLASPDEPYQLKRIPIQNGDGEQGLADKLQSAGVS